MSAEFATLLYLKFDFKIYHIIFHVESNNWDNYLQPWFYFVAVDNGIFCVVQLFAIKSKAYLIAQPA